MSIQGEQVLLRAYLQSADRSPLSPTHERLLQSARSSGLAGATVMRGIMGFGLRGPTKRSVWSLVEHVPIIVEVVDSAPRLVDFLQGPLAKVMVSGMITLERANVMMYRHAGQADPGKLVLGELVRPLSTLPRIKMREHMTIENNGVLLRIFIGESGRFGKKLLYEAIVNKARELGLAGATVLAATAAWPGSAGEAGCSAAKRCHQSASDRFPGERFSMKRR